jgi:hypothetical protein
MMMKTAIKKLPTQMPNDTSAGLLNFLALTDTMGGLLRGG